MFINYNTKNPIHYGYNNYVEQKQGVKMACGTAKQSFISLLQSEGIDTNKEYLIIKIL